MKNILIKLGKRVFLIECPNTSGRRRLYMEINNYFLSTWGHSNPNQINRIYSEKTPEYEKYLELYYTNKPSNLHFICF